MDSSTTNIQLPLEAKDQEIIPVTKFPPLSLFDKSTEYPAIIVPVRETAQLRKSLKDSLLQIPKTKNVYNNPEDQNTRILVLSGEEALTHEKVQALLKDKSYPQSNYTLTTSYSDRSVEEVLREILPDSITEVPAAFEVVGTIAHLNLRDELLPYKYIVGKVILDKNQPRIQTVVNKLGTIANEYRTFGMEVIAGNDNENWSLVTVKEEGCEFTLDFQQVYWNSRLGFEHKRLVQLIKKDAQQRSSQPTIVADLMAGVGPFAVPLTASLAKKKKNNKKHKKSENNHSNNADTPNIIVHANDLNPASYKYLKINAEKNKCPNNRLIPYNMDARAFCHKLQDESIEFHHVIMNLPASAPEFLDCFRGFRNTISPRIHVYCFAPKPLEEDPLSFEKEVIERCSAALECPLKVEEHQVRIRIVRDVSPQKNMVCISFSLPDEARKLERIAVEARVGGATTNGEEIGELDDDDLGEPQQKRTKTSNDN